MPQIYRGFSLLELLIALAIGGIVLGFAVPGMRTFLANNRSATQTNMVVGALALARNEAVTRSLPVTLCALATADGSQCVASGAVFYWDRGWMLFVDNSGSPGQLDAGDVLLQRSAGLDNSQLTATTAFLRYQPDGFLSSGATTLRLRVPGCSLQGNRDIAISPQGRVTVSHVAC